MSRDTECNGSGVSNTLNTKRCGTYWEPDPEYNLRAAAVTLEALSYSLPMQGCVCVCETAVGVCVTAVL